MSYHQSQLNRQAILNHLHASPLKSAKQISNETSLTRNSVENCVRQMTARGEIEKIGAGTATRYKAIAKTTVSAEQIIAEMAEKRHKAGLKAEKAQAGHGIVQREGYYSQRGGGWLSQHDSGGQGAVRGVVGVQSSAGMI